MALGYFKQVQYFFMKLRRSDRFVFAGLNVVLKYSEILPVVTCFLCNITSCCNLMYGYFTWWLYDMVMPMQPYISEDFEWKISYFWVVFLRKIFYFWVVFLRKTFYFWVVFLRKMRLLIVFLWNFGGNSLDLTHSSM